MYVVQRESYNMNYIYTYIYFKYVYMYKYVIFERIKMNENWKFVLTVKM